jgi:two-component system, NarL family, nitrate/nitrite response regulator NarL
MTIESTGKPVLVCDSQPVAIQGLRFLLEGSGDLRFAGAVCSLERLFDLARSLNPAAIILDKALGVAAVMDWLRQATTLGLPGAPVVWGAGINEPEALRFLQAGARGILRRTSEADTMLVCLRAVTSGTTWMEDGIFGNAGTVLQPRRSHLTAREMQIAELVERGLRNRDIARTLGIQTGTVKIHLKHIFEKTGVRGRYGLALTGLREKGTLPPLTNTAVQLPPM